MSRTRSIDLVAVVDAALDCFAVGGLKRTLMSDIARRAGVATGSLYNIATSKDALFLAAFTSQEDLGRALLPLANPERSQMAQLISARVDEITSLPLQELAMRRRRAANIDEELRALIAERFGVMASNWRLLAAIEQTARDYPTVLHAYFYEGRKAYVAALAKYLRSRELAGQIRPMADSASTARFIIETITWWAWHRHEDPDSAHIDDAQALTVNQDMITAALRL